MNLRNCSSGLFVKNATVAKDFYVNVLGATVTADFDIDNNCLSFKGYKI